MLFPLPDFFIISPNSRSDFSSWGMAETQDGRARGPWGPRSQDRPRAQPRPCAWPLQAPSRDTDGQLNWVTTINTNSASCPQTYITADAVSGRRSSISVPISCPAPRLCSSCKQSCFWTPRPALALGAPHGTRSGSGLPPFWAARGGARWLSQQGLPPTSATAPPQSPPGTKGFL